LRRLIGIGFFKAEKGQNMLEKLKKILKFIIYFQNEHDKWISVQATGNKNPYYIYFWTIALEICTGKKD
jgi:hypothetical protein